MENPKDRKYTKTDEWVLMDGNTATIGITDYAQEQLSDVVFFEANVAVGDMVKGGTICATIESVKAAADVNLPVSGKVVAINEDLAKSPEWVNGDPFGKAWIMKVELSSPGEIDSLMDGAGYDAYLAGRSH